MKESCTITIDYQKCVLGKGDKMKTMDEMIKDDNQAICDNIDDLVFKSRDRVAQNMLSFFRNLVEHIAIKIYLDAFPNITVERSTTTKAFEYLKTDNEFYFLRQFRSFLQYSRSHYTPDNDGAERLVLKYYEYLLQIKFFVKKRYNMDILQNLENFPLDLDETLQEYYEKIMEKLEHPRQADNYEERSEKFYVQKVKPFFANKHVYYENTLIPANDESSKFNRVVVFSKNKITINYAIKVRVHEDIIAIEEKAMPVKILVTWRASIRPCELKNFARLFNMHIDVRSNLSEYNALMNFLTKMGLNLVEILEASDEFYEMFKNEIARNARNKILSPLFDEVRQWVKYRKKGSNTVRYLLYGLNNKIIKSQLSGEENYKISGLYTDIKTLPFEDIPFNSSLVEHNPSIFDLLSCIGDQGHEDEIMAHRVTVNADSYGKLYTNIDDLEGFQDVEKLVKKYNSKLYWKHLDSRKLEILGKNIFIKGYEANTYSIIQKLIELSENGVENYKPSVDMWLTDNSEKIDCDEKRDILRCMFENSKVAMIYGAAGTGKSTLINHISSFWNESKKLYLANTHPAVENLRRKVTAGNTCFMTIKKYLNRYSETDILFIDECSMVSNRDIAEILKKGSFRLLVLVGDIYQIEAIQFGNWFSLARSFVPIKAQFELTKPYRTDNKSLLELWEKVRNYKEDIAECLSANGYTSDLDKTIFEKESEDEIVLCLNYAGLYGINNINRFLQNDNDGKAVALGMWLYKVGDPVLFNESSKYENVLYNNLKGRIIDIEETSDEVYFSIEIDRVLNGMHTLGTGIELLEQRNPEKSIVRFPVKKKMNGDDDGDEMDMETNVPFQIAYAVSIHKAQGLEYKSVKIIITKEIDEMISHNIFYTAITRTKDRLKIYWTAESQQKILSNFKNDMTLNDAKIFVERKKLRIVKKANK